MRDEQLHILWWAYSDGSNQDVVRAYADIKKAEADLALLKEHSTVDWRLTSVPIFR
jgi:hypothetical protein